jgi:ferredoxin
MCKFCDDFLRLKRNKIPIRNTSAEDNVCNYVVNNDCDQCNNGCSENNHYFDIILYKDTISIDYTHKINNLTIETSSARFNINYCPLCGKRMSEVIHPEELKYW